MTISMVSFRRLGKSTRTIWRPSQINLFQQVSRRVLRWKRLFCRFRRTRWSSSRKTIRSLAV